jgi:methionine-rich copper-binding protein CopC
VVPLLIYIKAENCNPELIQTLSRELIMLIRSSWCYRSMLGLEIISAVLLSMRVAKADSLHVRYSVPAAESTIRGRNAQYLICFDGLVDHASSRLEITQSGRVVQSFPAVLDSEPDVLSASGEAPAPGQYLLHWQATSIADGTVSSGDVRFSVTQ